MNKDYLKARFPMLMLIFAFGGIFGFIYEEIFYRFDLGEWVKRGTTFGPWIPIYGFGGLHTEGSTVCLDPHLPEGWTRYSFSFLAGDGTVRAEVDASGCRLCMLAGTHACVRVSGILTEVHA